MHNKLITFEDPNIPVSKIFSINNYEIKIPIYTAEKISLISKSVKENAKKFYDTTELNEILNIINTANRKLTSNDFLKGEMFQVISNVTGFSKENIEHFGLEPLAEFNLGWIINMNDLQNLTESYENFQRFNDGYLKAYGIPKIEKYTPPDLITHILAGNVIGLQWLNVTLGCAAKSGQMFKLPSQDLISFMCYLDLIGEISPEFRKTIAAGFFPSNAVLESSIYSVSDVIIAMGSDVAIKDIQRKAKNINPRTRVIAHGHKIGFQAICRDFANPEVAELCAWGLCAFDGNACFSPSNIFIERGGELSPKEFANEIANHMERIADKIPPKSDLRTAFGVKEYRDALKLNNIVCLSSKNMDYTLGIDSQNPYFSPTCQERTAVIKPIDDIKEMPNYLKKVGIYLQTCGIAYPPDELLSFSDLLGKAGVTNIHVTGAEYVFKPFESHDGIFDHASLFFSNGLRWLAVNFQDIDAEIRFALKRKRRIVH